MATFSSNLDVVTLFLPFFGLFHFSKAKAFPPSSVVAVVTADHVIPDITSFRSCLQTSISIAKNNNVIVTIGIDPSTSPQEWTSFGTLKADRSILDPFSPLLRFEEKPSLDRAEEMIEQGEWYWNSGMFCFQIGTLESALQDLQPSMYSLYCSMNSAHNENNSKLAEALFAQFPSQITHPLVPFSLADNSIDYALMVPLTLSTQPLSVSGAVVPGTFTWIDIGSWSALRKVKKPDEHGNIVLGDVDCNDCSDCIIVAEEGRRIKTRGLKGEVVVSSKEGKLLICPANSAAEVKQLLSMIDNDDFDSIGFDYGDCELHGKLISLFKVSSLYVNNASQEVVVEKRR
ncbi:hypothetical protein GEMRC1_008214 [Eukaryota sp. GEM-RC1]